MSAPPTSTIVLVGSTDRRLQEMLAGLGAHVTTADVRSLADLSKPGPRRPDLLVLDIRDTRAVPPALAVLKRQMPSLGVVIVGPSLDPSLMLEAMRAGVTEFLTDPINPEDVARTLSNAAAQRIDAEAGRIFAFVGAKGGVGTTTVAVNVATVLGRAGAPGRTLLIDLHQASGDAAIFLGAEPRFSVADALDNTHRLDRTYLNGLVTPAAACLDLLAAPDRAAAGHADSTRVRALLEFVTTAYRYVVLDLPRSDANVLDALDNAATIVVVANQELATVRSAGRMASMLRQRYGRERVHIVVSRSDRQADIGFADVERAVGSDITHTFPSDYRLALQALHKGRPLALDNHHELSGSIRRFALGLAGLDAPERQAERPSGLLGLFGGRR